MFGKLMKYEMNYLIRIFAPMWVVVMALCALSRIVVRPEFDNMTYIEESFLPVIVIVLAVIALITMMVVTAVVLIQRFYKGMYGDEGYLMFTLPVTTGGLIHSKALSAMVMLLVTELIALAGILLMISYPVLWRQMGMTFGEAIKMMLELNNLTTAQAAAVTFWAIIAGIMTVVQGIYTIYLAISLGQLWKKHPIAGAIIAYYVVMLVVGAVQSVLANTFGGSALELILKHMNGTMNYSAVFAIVMIVMTLYLLVMTVIAFLGTKLILDKKLNIQ